MTGTKFITAMQSAGYYDGELCLRPLVVDMSAAIALVYTHEGFAIAADGLKRDSESNRAVSESAQKIFKLKHPAHHLGYALAGPVGITKKGSDMVLFNFIDKTPLAAQQLEQSNAPSLYHFAHELAEILRQSLDAFSALPPDAVTG